MRLNRLNSTSSTSINITRATSIPTLLCAFENLLEAKAIIIPSLAKSASAEFKTKKRKHSSCSPPTKYLITNLSRKLQITPKDYPSFKKNVESCYSQFSSFPISYQTVVLESMAYVSIVEDMRRFKVTPCSIHQILQEKKVLYGNIISTHASHYTEKGFPVDTVTLDSVREAWWTAVSHQLLDLSEQLQTDSMYYDEQIDTLMERILTLFRLIQEALVVFGSITAETAPIVNKTALFYLTHCFKILSRSKINDPIVIGYMGKITALLSTFEKFGAIDEEISTMLINVGIIYLEYLGMKKTGKLFLMVLSVGIQFLEICVTLERENREEIVERFQALFNQLPAEIKTIDAIDTAA